MSDGKLTIKASELIKMLAEKKPVAEVENDEDCYVRPKAEIEVDEGGLCSLSVGKAIPSDPDLGNFLIEICGVTITVGRGIDGPEDDYEFEGAEIVYDGATKDDVMAAIEGTVRCQEMSEFEFRYNDTEFDPDDVEESVEADYEVFAEDDEGNIYAFESEDEVSDELEVIESEDAIHKLVEAWSDDGGEIGDDLQESGGPWSL